MSSSIEKTDKDTVPSLLEELARALLSESNTCTQTDFLFALIIVSMMEDGFLPVDDKMDVIDLKSIDKGQFTKWRSTGRYELLFIVTEFNTVSMKLIMTPIDATALVNVVIKDLDSETYCIWLPVHQYISDIQSMPVQNIYQNLKEFSITFKNRIVAPVRSRIISHCGYPSASLLGLPEELLFKIVLHLPIADIIDMSKTCTKLRTLMDNDGLWHDLFKRDFTKLNNTAGNRWKDLYKELYVAQQDRRQKIIHRLVGTIHDYYGTEYSDFPYDFDNLFYDYNPYVNSIDVL